MTWFPVTHCRQNSKRAYFFNSIFKHDLRYGYRVDASLLSILFILTYPTYFVRHFHINNPWTEQSCSFKYTTLILWSCLEIKHPTPDGVKAINPLTPPRAQADEHQPGLVMGNPPRCEPRLKPVAAGPAISKADDRNPPTLTIPLQHITVAEKTVISMWRSICLPWIHHSSIQVRW